MKMIFIALTIAVILSQSVHTWFVFNSFSRIDQKWLKTFQAVLFCSILSVAIFAFVVINKPMLALLGAFVEIIINIYYYGMDFFENGYKAFTGDSAEVKKKRINSMLKFWRRNWIAIFFGLLLPSLIYIFSAQL